MKKKKFLVTRENAKEYVKKIGGFIRQKTEAAGREGLVLGMSGGLDCSVAACLARAAGVDVLLVMLPDGGDMERSKSRAHAMELVEKFGFNHRVINIGEICLGIEKSAGAGELSDISRINIRPRVRMSVLYSLAQTHRRFVLGTGNLDERLLGYFTKWGDGACDLNPLGMLTKGEIRILAQELGVPKSIIGKPPSAGLFEGQTDEDDLGVTYAQIDEYILKGTSGSAAADKTIRARIKMSAHKLKPIPVFEE